jgi:hypothetical protein
VNNSATSKINSTAAKKWIRIKVGQETIVRPQGMCDYWIDKARQKHGIAQVGNHLTSLG